MKPAFAVKKLGQEYVPVAVTYCIDYLNGMFSLKLGSNMTTTVNKNNSERSL